MSDCRCSIPRAKSIFIETILRDQICQYLHDNKLLSKNQYGFRKKFSTIDSLLFCTEFIRNKTGINNFVTAAFLDLSKAFDSINYDILDIKLGNLGFDENSKISLQTKEVSLQTAANLLYYMIANQMN